MPSSSLHVLAEAVSYAPLTSTLPPAIAIKLPEAEAACEGGEGSSWARTRAHTHLRVGILGCSTTAGCGAKAPSPFCAPQLSWGRHAHDALVARNNSVHTHIFSKNAVEAEFFWDCTANLLPPGRVDVVILEVLENVYSWPFALLVNATVAAINRAAPHASIAFIGWDKLPNLSKHNKGAAKGNERLVPEMRAAVLGHSAGLGLINVPLGLHALSLNVSTAYAQTAHGKYDHHPNGFGHELIGRLTAGCVARWLGRQKATSTSVGGGGDDTLALDSGRLASWSSEQCYNTAVKIPVTRKVGFELIDDGGAKGVAKPGYASTTPGDLLVIGPLSLHAGAHGWCWRKVRVRFGYLVATNPMQGALRLDCHGSCVCRGIKSRWLRANLPFPVLETNVHTLRQHKAAVGFYAERSDNVAMTSFTTFIAELRNGTEPCDLHVTHVRGGKPANASRVRVDSLAFMGPHGGPETGRVIC